VLVAEIKGLVFAKHYNTRRYATSVVHDAPRSQRQ
jgi:hypothetical protein